MNRETMASNPLLVFREVSMALNPARIFGPINWPLGRNARVWVEQEPGELATLLDNILTGRIRPVKGYIEEIGRVAAQSDSNLRESISLNRSISELLDGVSVPEFIWLENRRRPLPVLLDLLGVSPSHTRAPLKHQPPEVVEKYLALEFMMSRADLLVGAEIFRSSDPSIKKALAMRWEDFTGTVVVIGRREDLPGKIDCKVRFTPDGVASITPLGERGAPNLRDGME